MSRLRWRSPSNCSADSWSYSATWMPGRSIAQGAQGGGQDARVHGVGHVADAQAALLAAAEPPAEVLQPVRVAQQGACLGQEDAAVGGQPDALLAAFEEGQAQVLLQLGDLPAERRLGDVQLLGGAADVFGLGDGDEVAELTQVKHVGPRRTQVCPSKSWTVSSMDPNLEHARPTDRTFSDESVAIASSRHSRSRHRYRKDPPMSIKPLLPGTLGFGTAPLGNMFRAIPDEEAAATVEAAWDQGIRYFDTAPFYGAGLSEIRLGDVLAQHPRDEFVLSTKVGRVILDEIEDPAVRDLGEKGGLFEHGRPNKMVNDYTADATLRSIEDSLKRLRTDRLDIVWVHDVAQDFYGDEWLAAYETARTGAFRVLQKLREEGVIKGWGLGVNRVEPLELTLDLDEPKPDAFLLAGRYTLLDHDRALQRLLPAAAAQDVDIVVGGPYSSGILAGGTHFEYQQAPAHIIDKVERIKALAERHGVGIKSAALQFALAHPATAAVIPGATKPSRIAEDVAALGETIPAAFWTDLREERLIAQDAPVPATA
jgi:D-threo-aldose 1-dehydrogenase